MPRCPSPLGLDVLRATLGPSLAAPYARAFGPVPWLTAGTLSWPVADSLRVAAVWDAWAGGLPGAAPTALRVTRAVVAVDVALAGDPAGAFAWLAPLRGLHPSSDTAGTAAPAILTGRVGGAPAPLVSVCVPLAEPPGVELLIDAALQAPDGVGLGVRHQAAGRALFGIGIAADAARVRAAVDRAALRLAPPEPDRAH